MVIGKGAYMKEIMNYLRKAEGSGIHYNSGEKDITAGYGVYRYSHPDAKVFRIIDNVASKLGIVYSSTTWTTAVVNKVNAYIETNHEVKKEVYDATVDFYKEYLRRARLDLFPNECKVAMMSMFTNSEKGAWTAVQNTLLTLEKNGKLSMMAEDLSKPDGAFGRKTKDGLFDAKLNKIDPMYMETLMLLNMLDYYVELWSANPRKYDKYLRGWKERMVKLSNA